MSALKITKTIATTAIFIVCPVHVSSAEPVTVPGTIVSMEPPDGFELAGTFSGFEHASSRSTIIVTEFPGQSYGDLSRIFADVEAAAEVFSTQGITITGRRTVRAGGSEVPVLTGTQEPVGVQVTKYLALLSGEKVVLVTFNIVGGARTTEAMVLAAVASSVLGPVSTIDERIAQLPFSFEAAAPFEPFDVVGGTSVVLSTSDEIDAPGTLPVVAIARSLEKARSDDAAELSRSLMQGTSGFENATIAVSRSVEFAGGAGYLVEAAAAERTAVQYVRITRDGHYVRLFATGETGALQNTMPAVRAIADSVSSPSR